jgi:hypothetical protein
MALISLFVFMSAGPSYAESSNPFYKGNDDIYVEGWYQVNGDRKLTGMLTIDIINRGSSAVSLLEYSGVPHFDECSIKPEDWTCQYDPKSGILKFIMKDGPMEPSDRVNFVILFKSPQTKKLTGDGYVTYGSGRKKEKLSGLTRIDIVP